jgi:hypothetical protein
MATLAHEALVGPRQAVNAAAVSVTGTVADA